MTCTSLQLLRDDAIAMRGCVPVLVKLAVENEWEPSREKTRKADRLGWLAAATEIPPWLTLQACRTGAPVDPHLTNFEVCQCHSSAVGRSEKNWRLLYLSLQLLTINGRTSVTVVISCRKYQTPLLYFCPRVREVSVQRMFQEQAIGWLGRVKQTLLL